MPERCPVCGSRIYRPEDEANYFCENSECPAQLRGRIEHFAQRGAMDIEGLGEAAVEQLVQLKLVTNISDLYELHRHRQKLMAIDRWGEKSTQNLLEGIDRSKQQPYHRVLFALGIRHVGAGVAQLLADQFRSMEALRQAKEEELQSAQGIGPTIAESIVHFFAEKHNRDIVRRLGAAGVAMKARAAAAGKLSGKTFVLTGTLPGFSRAEAKQIIEKNGGRVAGSVSRGVDYVLAGAEPGSKLEKARALGIRIISESEFTSMIK
jgi:DNA ligase (NAD+)